MVLIQKRSYKTVANVGTDPMDGDLLVQPLCDGAVVGSVVNTSSVGDHPLAAYTGGSVTIRRPVSVKHLPCLTVVLYCQGWRVGCHAAKGIDSTGWRLSGICPLSSCNACCYGRVLLLLACVCMSILPPVCSSY